MNKIFATVSLKSILVHIPCSSGIASFKTKFGHLDPDTPIPLLACLESNSVQDVIWALRAVHQDISAVIPLIAADFAESVLHLFEEKFPNDDRPRKAIEAARSGERKKARAASYASYAAYTTAAADASIACAARAASAARAVYAAACAATTASPAADDDAAYYATHCAAHYAAQAADACAASELSKQAEILRKYLTDKE